jgi:hypothetical protein
MQTEGKYRTLREFRDQAVVIWKMHEDETLRGRVTQLLSGSIATSSALFL